MPVTGKLEFHVTDENGTNVTLVGRTLESSNVSWLGWEQRGRAGLYVQYKSGGRYFYPGVSRQKCVSAANSKSVGSYINKRIKPHHEAVKLT